MPFDPFDNKESRTILAKVCKGKSLAPLKKVFDSVIAVRAKGNRDVGAITSKQCEQCLALGEIVASGRGNSSRNVKLPAEAGAWIEKVQPLDDALAEAAHQAVNEVRTYSAAWAIAEDIGWREWTSYCRGLYSRLKKPAKKGKVRTRAPVSDIVQLCEARDWAIQKEKDAVVGLRIRKGQRLTEADMEPLLALKTLKSLALADQKLSDDELGLLSKFKQLASLSIHHCKVESKGFKRLDLPKLKVLSLHVGGVNEILANCRHLGGLRTLDVSDSDLHGDGLKSMGNFPLLSRLDISRCHQKKGDDWSELQNLKKLKEIRATGTILTSAGIETLLQLTQLRELGLHYAKHPLVSLAPLAKLKQLQVLDLSGEPSPESEWAFLSHLKKLRRLKLQSCPHVTDQTLEIISKLPAIEQLGLAGTAITNKSEKALADMPRLRSLDALQTQLSRAAHKRLDRLFESRWPDDD